MNIETQQKVQTEMTAEIGIYREEGRRPLTGRRERFAQLLAGGSNQSVAYTAAGYSHDPSNAAKLAKECKVAERVEWLQQQVNAKVGETLSKQASEEVATREWVMARLKQNALQTLGELPVIRDVFCNGRSHQEQVTIYNPAAANRALEILGQALGMFRDDGQQRTDLPVDAPKSVEDPRIVEQLERYRRKARAAAKENSTFLNLTD